MSIPKGLNSVKSVDFSGNGGIIGIQFFAEKDIANQESSSLKRAIRKYSKKITLHQDKINNPQNHVVNWESKDLREKNGLIKHWQKEIRNFQSSIDDRIAELKKRGDYDE
jgi:peptidoglycan hydrolase CwlO-like protein